MLIINADDWGRDRFATETALACHERRRISATSAMVFMQDSERAAGLANSCGIDVGLHVNFTLQFNSPSCPVQVKRSQDCINRFLSKGKYALLVYNPFLRKHFRRVFQAQLEEFLRIYGRSPSHIDGHQHMHLSTNMLSEEIIPRGQTVRRSFSFRRGQKTWLNRAYRGIVDWSLARRYSMTDFFFALSDHLESSKLRAILTLARSANVELMTHPWNQDEYSWLMGNEYVAWIENARLEDYSTLRPNPEKIHDNHTCCHGVAGSL